MTPAEQIVYDKLKAQGYKVLHNGWPDFLAHKDGKVIAVEVKYERDSLKASQAECHRLLDLAGLPVSTVYVTEEMLEQDTQRKEANFLLERLPASAPEEIFNGPALNDDAILTQLVSY